MTKQELQQLRHLDSELRTLKQQLKDLEESIGLTSAASDGMPRGNKISRPTEDQALRIKTLLEKVKALQRQVLDEKIRAWDFISSLDDSLLRQIIVCRFVDGKSWFNVSRAIGRGMTEDGCRMYFNRMFKDDDSPIE